MKNKMKKILVFMGVVAIVMEDMFTVNSHLSRCLL